MARRPRPDRARRGLFGAVLLLAAAAPAPPRDLAARLPDGRTLNLWCAGTSAAGAPTILLESGWSADSRGWARLMAPLSQRTRTCAIDRAGEGRSSAGPLPRDGRAIARDLADALKAAAVAPPYLLVGHSSGGLYVRQFAIDRPREVIGMVLVDPAVPPPQRAGAGAGHPAAALARRCLAAARAGPIPADDPALARCRTTPPERAAERWQSRLSEIEMLFAATADAIELAPAAPADAPVIILSAGRGHPSEEALAAWHALHRAIAARHLAGEARIVPEAGHLIHVEAPEAVVRAVDDVLARAGAPAAAARGCRGAGPHPA